MQAITVRAATQTDLPELTRLWHEKMVLQQQFDRRLTFAPDSAAKWAEAAADWLAQAECGLFVAQRDAQLIGYVIGSIGLTLPGLLLDQIGYVTDISVDAHSHQGGLGRRLLTALREWFAARDIQQIVAFVPHRSTVEQAFWRAQSGAEWIDLMWIK
jgi:ribosomal protein S18 acetylase RimI-like enzyme